eukprot:Rmarinus@m.6418
MSTTSPKATKRTKKFRNFMKRGGKHKNGGSAYGDGSSLVFGVPLTDVRKTSTGLPVVADLCLACLEQNGLDEEGLFRLSGSRATVNELVHQFDTEGAVSLNGIDVHAVAGVYKQYLRDLPEPLIPYEEYDQFIKCAGLLPDPEEAEELGALISHLPIEHYTFFMSMIQFLLKVIQRAEVTKMDAKNVSIVIAPNILRQDVGAEITDLNASMSSVNTYVSANDAAAAPAFQNLLEHWETVVPHIVVRDPTESETSALLRELSTARAELESERATRIELESQLAAGNGPAEDSTDLKQRVCDLEKQINQQAAAYEKEIAELKAALAMKGGCARDSMSSMSGGVADVTPLSDSCGGCGRPVRQENLYALDKYWHFGCLKCAVCSTEIQSDFYENEGKPCCPDCYSKRVMLCDACGERIESCCVSALGKRYHQSCFTCCLCKRPFKSSFLLRDQGPMCSSCVPSADDS